jgi:hypothetical protein
MLPASLVARLLADPVLPLVGRSALVAPAGRLLREPPLHSLSVPRRARLPVVGCRAVGAGVLTLLGLCLARIPEGGAQGAAAALSGTNAAFPASILQLYAHPSRAARRSDA